MYSNMCVYINHLFTLANITNKTDNNYTQETLSI